MLIFLALLAVVLAGLLSIGGAYELAGFWYVVSAVYFVGSNVCERLDGLIAEGAG